jgi:hypothetical protein
VSFAIGDEVTWHSQAGGTWKWKIGKIAEIVPPGGQLLTLRGGGLGRNFGRSLGRKEVSYVVKVGAKLYWPLASKLRLVVKGKVCPTCHGKGTVQDDKKARRRAMVEALDAYEAEHGKITEAEKEEIRKLWPQETP